MTDTALASSYQQLKEEIARIFVEGHEKARQAVERQRVQVCWEVGQLLDGHLLANEARAGYGERVMAQLAGDLKMHRQRLYEMIQVFRAFPIVRSTGQLTFSHYIALSRIPLPEVREAYADKSAEEGWSVNELQLALRSEGFTLHPGESPQGTPDPGAAVSFPATTGPPTDLVPKKGRLSTYRVLQGDELYPMQLDLGFRLRLGLNASESAGLEPGSAIECLPDPEGSLKRGDHCYSVVPDNKPRTKLYTYGARVLSIIDGDTLWAAIDCGFGVSIEEKLRLRGIDTPEMSEDEGKVARLFVLERLKPGQVMALTTSRTDLFDRYVADVFYLPGEIDVTRVLEAGTYLNRELLEAGLARRFED